MRPRQASAGRSPGTANRRINFWYGVLILMLAVIIGQLFYLQIIRHDYYRQQALSDQQRESVIPADRGVIKVHEGSGLVPLVLNQKLYTLYVDPGYVKDHSGTAAKVAQIMGVKQTDYEAAMKKTGTRYVVLAKRISDAQQKQISALKLPGIGLTGQDYRTYPQNSLAAQILGFVNDDGKGNYGLEQAMNKDLAGTDGQLKAVTDVNGIPLAASRDNIQTDPKSGSDIVLTLDIGMQKQLETYLAQDAQKYSAKQSSALIIDINTGAIKAMANFPTYDPGQYFDISDASIFNNAAISEPFELGSIMKTLTTSAALDLGVVKPDTSFYDPGQWPLDGSIIQNVEEERGSGPSSITRLLNLSMNTGATWELMQMGGQTGVVNQQARERWYDYLVNHFEFGKPTGIEQGYESEGYIPKPNTGYALQLTYANMSFGQAMTVTPLQMAAALSSVLNGGTYFQPRLVDQIVSASGQTATKKPIIVRKNVVSASTGQSMANLMVGVVQTKVTQGFPFMKFPDNYMVGGKTGTAQIANPAGGYYDDRFNGTFIGFVGGDKPQYLIMVDVKEPHVGGYAGSTAAMPLWADLAHMLIDNFNVAQKSH